MINQIDNDTWFIILDFLDKIFILAYKIKRDNIVESLTFISWYLLKRCDYYI